jgi:hypothetical protein
VALNVEAAANKAAMNAAHIRTRNEEFFQFSKNAAAGIITDAREQQLNDFIRELLVCILIYCFLYAIAYFTIKYLRKSKESDDYVLDYEDAIADRVSIWLCTFTLATCFGAVLLLPMSIIANEIILLAPENFYWKWLNSSLIHGLWNAIFLFSNLSLFMFLPFAHLFAESIGLPGYKKGIKSRVLETSLLLLLIVICVIGISFVISSVFDSDNAASHSFFNISDYHLPFLYSCISFIGVLFLLICTPLGFAHLFKVVSNLIMKSTFRVDLKEDIEMYEFEENCIQCKIDDLNKRRVDGRSTNRNELVTNLIQKEEQLKSFNQMLSQVRASKKEIVNKSKRSTIFRNLCYPFIMIFLLILNVKN